MGPFIVVITLRVMSAEVTRAMWARRREAMFALRRERFAEPFYARHRAHVTGRPNGCAVAWLVGSGTVVAMNLAVR